MPGRPTPEERVATLQEIMALVRPFEEGAKAMGFEFAVRLRHPGRDYDRFSLQTGYYAQKSVDDDPMCPDDRKTDDD